MADYPEDPQLRTAVQGSLGSQESLSRARKITWATLANRIRRYAAFVATATVMASAAVSPVHGAAAAQHTWQQSNASGHALTAVDTSQVVGPASVLTAILGNGRVAVTSDTITTPTLTITPLDSSVLLSARTQEPTGGNSIIRWQYSQETGAGIQPVGSASDSAVDTSWIDISSTSTFMTHTVDNLVNGQRYFFKVRTVNTNGNSPASRSANAIPATTPPKPRLSATPGNTTAKLSASIQDTGGRTITEWQYRRRIKNGLYDRWKSIDNTTRILTHTVRELVNGNAYTYEIRAVNSIGNGITSDAVTVIPGRPVKPVLSAAAGDKRAALSMSVSTTGGYDLTKWEYRQKTGSATYGEWVDIDNTSTSVTHTIGGLINGTVYKFKVRAVNRILKSPESYEIVVTPAAAPPKPNLSATLNNTNVKLSAWVSSTNGSNITKWEYRQKTGSATYGEWVDIDNTSTSVTHTIGGLIRGTVYKFKVRAINGIGNSPESNEVMVTPVLPPQTPSQNPLQTPSQNPQDYFVDDNGNKHESSINVIASQGITKGCDTEGLNYCPDDPVTRAQMASFITRTHNLTLPTGQTGVSHVDVTGNIHRDNIRVIAHHGVTKGCDTEGLNYCPDDPVTRAQMASFITRSFNLTLPTGQTGVSYEDATDNFHEDNIRVIAHHGITKGCDTEGLNYCPDDPVTRAQMASFITRALDL